MVVFDSASVTVDGTSVTVIKVPDDVLGNFERCGAVMYRAEAEFKRPIILLGSGTGGTLGNHDLRRALRDQQFDPAKANWSQWNMAE
jgi:hypothetical protein